MLGSVPLPSLARIGIGDRTQGVHYSDDGSLTLFPTDPLEAANWLPAPDGPFTVIIRAYGGDTAIAEDTYRLPAITPP